MSSSRPSGPPDFLVAGLFATVGLVLLYLAAFQEGKWPHWLLGPLLLVSCAAVVVPEFRDSFGSSLRQIAVRFPGGGVRTGSAAPALGGAQQPEKPVDAVLPRPPRIPPVMREGLDLHVLDGLKDVADPLVHWSVAASFIQNGNYGTAQAVIEAALEQHPAHPKLLIAAGYLWARPPAGNWSKAIEAARRAIEGARGREEFREQFYVAHANLCYYLALRGQARDKAAALEAGRCASGHADEFENRDSLKINYGFAQAQFGTTRDELVSAITFLAELHRRKMDAQERSEVNQYLEMALGKLHALDETPPSR